MTAGLLLTGGASRRMGVDKAELVVDGERLADRGARILSEVCDPVVEVGPGRTGLDAVLEDPPGEGPLVAVAGGGDALRQRGHQGAALVLAVDLPLVTPALLRILAEWPGGRSVVPFVEGEPQPVCARYSAGALALAARAVEAGERSLRAFLRTVPDLQWAGPRMWGHVAGATALADVDTPEDLRALGLDAYPTGAVEQ